MVAAEFLPHTFKNVKVIVSGNETVESKTIIDGLQFGLSCYFSLPFDSSWFSEVVIFKTD